MKKASTKIYIVMNKKMRYNLLGMPHFCFVLVGNLWDREKKMKSVELVERNWSTRDGTRWNRNFYSIQNI